MADYSLPSVRGLPRGQRDVAIYRPRLRATDYVDDAADKTSPGVQRRLSSEEFVALLLRHEHRIRGFIATLMLPSSEVDDVFQNACIAAFRKLESFSYVRKTPDDEFVCWVCTIARYEVLQILRRSRSTTKVIFNSELVKELADMQLQGYELLKDRSEALAGCVERLSKRDQSLIRMRYENSGHVAEIATRLGLSVNGAYKALERIRAKLLECVRLKLLSRR